MSLEFCKTKRIPINHGINYLKNDFFDDKKGYILL